MFGYYVQLAFRSLRRDKAFTALIIATLGVGVGAFIATLAVLKILSGDPLPMKSDRLFTPELNPLTAQQYSGNTPPLANLLSYQDAMSLLRTHNATYQAATALTSVKVTPMEGRDHPFFTNAVMTTADFFPMFDTKFQYGYGWTTEHGEQRARVVVISKRLNDSLFGGTNSVGRSIRVASHLYRIIGVLRKWTPQPKFYSLGLGGRSYGASDDVYIPLHSARADKMQPETVYCWHAPGPELESSSCVWMSIWVQLEHPLDKSSYKTFLSHYADMQKRVGRFGNSNIWLPDLPQFLSQQQVVPSNVYLQVYLALGFLLLCIIGAAGLQLAKTASRRSEIDIRRALGASRSLIFSQYMVESATLGTLGALLGIGLGELGLWEIRSLPVEYAHLAHLRADMLAVAVALAIVASLMAGLLPAWRACAIDPQLK